MAALVFLRTYRCEHCDQRFMGPTSMAEASGSKRGLSFRLSRLFGEACPFCGGDGVRRSRKHHFRDTLLAWVAISPCRCHDCNTSFYRWSQRLPK